MPTQKDAGKAFEYALVTEANSILSVNFQTNLIVDEIYQSARKSFELYNNNQKLKYQTAAIAAINHIITLEPKLSHTTSPQDILTLSLMADREGQGGDVRDILFIRSSQNWEIGISAKNNHKAVKHSRLSAIKDFGQDWLGFACSQNYFRAITPIFQELQRLKEKGAYWRNMQNKHRSVYMPILNAFREELLAINQANNIANNLVSYLLGRHDFYKVIKGRREVEVIGFNLNGTLNLTTQGRPERTISRLRLPSQIIQLEYRPGFTDTLLLVCNEGWQISFRIHNAESLVVPSLKFDINLIGHPQSLYSHHIAY